MGELAVCLFVLFVGVVLAVVAQFYKRKWVTLTSTSSPPVETTYGPWGKCVGSTCDNIAFDPNTESMTNNRNKMSKFLIIGGLSVLFLGWLAVLVQMGMYVSKEALNTGVAAITLGTIFVTFGTFIWANGILQGENNVIYNTGLKLQVASTATLIAGTFLTLVYWMRGDITFGLANTVKTVSKKSRK